ncbi:TPA: integrase [Pseudomonas aeruginosa]|nr:integrase [Pseudomonas aeruginosa]
MQLPPELEFLAPFQLSPKLEYRSAAWLLNEFDDNIWSYSFGYKTPKTLDWNIELGDGTLLTAPKNKPLLNGLKYFLTACTRNSIGYMEQTNDLKGSQLQNFYAACLIVDYLLLNDKRFQLSTYGLEGLTEGNLIEVLDTIATSSSTEESVYSWTSRLREYCVNLMNSTDELQLNKILEDLPQLQIITSEQYDEDALGIPHQLIPSVRAALYLHGIYHKQAVNGNQPNSALIAKEIYKNTVYGRHGRKSIHTILCFNDNASTFDREYPGAPVINDSCESMTDQTYCIYRRALYNLGTLHEIGVPAPNINALVNAERYSPKLTPLGRFRTLPSAVVFKTLRQGIEFHIEYGEELMRALCRVALECRKRCISPSALTPEEVSNLAGEKLRKLGIRKLSLAVRTVNSGSYDTAIKGEQAEYFTSLRESAPLLELISVYIGAVQLTTGILMARRASELYSLDAATCLDGTESFLLFLNAKSTRHLFGMRRKEARPIEPIAADMIKNLIKMQKILKRIGYIHEFQTLFATPSLKGAAGLTEASSYVFNRNLDLFCDYFETPINAAGQRYYLRQHQLRRFFAMLFFYCGSFSKLDTLQWMMGHTDPNHVYRYITESTDGVVLAGAKAHYVAEQLHQGNIENFQALADLLKHKYGTNDFSVVDTNDLEDQIHDLMKEGWLEIEPEFFSDHQGKKFKVVARLIRTPEAA